MWRYKLVPMGRPRESQIEAWEAKLDELGGEGWEAVATSYPGFAEDLRQCVS